MKSSTLRMLRAYLLMASLGAACIDICAVMAMLVFDVPAPIFTSGTFRIAMAFSLVLLVLAARSLAAVAYQAALATRHTTVDLQRGGVVLRDDCPNRLLVMLYLRIHRQPQAMLAA